jgi:hypothetical protein
MVCVFSRHLRSLVFIASLLHVALCCQFPHLFLHAVQYVCYWYLVRFFSMFILDAHKQIVISDILSSRVSCYGQFTPQLIQNHTFFVQGLHQNQLENILL